MPYHSSKLQKLATMAIVVGTLFSGALASKAAIVSWDLSSLSEESRSTASGQFFLDLTAGSAAGSISSSYDPSTSDYWFFNDSAGGMDEEDEYEIGTIDNIIYGHFLYSGVVAGDIIGSGGDGTRVNRVSVVSNDPQSPFSIFTPGTTGYIGIEFLIGADTHYGWLAVTVLDISTTDVRLDSFAYNTVANESITIEPIPEPTMVGLLGLGICILAGGYALRRRKRPIISPV